MTIRAQPQGAQKWLVPQNERVDSGLGQVDQRGTPPRAAFCVCLRFPLAIALRRWKCGQSLGPRDACPAAHSGHGRGLLGVSTHWLLILSDPTGPDPVDRWARGTGAAQPPQCDKW